ncbi:MAG: ABC transporter permease [Synergistaceae bacterium]|nr:ABC transporter permease [Synergistaceae bacterium]HOP73342.1 ABC transporter permease [Thermoclostridium caenicola]
MIVSMIKKDLLRNKAINIIQWVFIFISAFLMVSGSLVITRSLGAIDGLFEIARPPHFLQMHAGGLDQADIDAFARSVDYVAAQQTQEMVNVDGSSICFVKTREGREERFVLSESMTDNCFVAQNREFDYLLDLDNGILRVSGGEAAVPVKYMKKYGLKPGDIMILSEGNFYMEFVITDFVRDAQMASSLASSVRFLVSDDDFREIWDNIGRPEYLVEFLLTDADLAESFQRLYEESGLPDNGTAVTYTLIRLVNAAGEGMKAVILILVSLLLVFMAIINLRFTILSAIEDEIREIGVLKAVGLSHGDVCRLYGAKYAFMSATGCLGGLIAAVSCNRLLTADIALDYGEQNLVLTDVILSVAAAAFLHVVISLFSGLVLRKIKHITVVQALVHQDAGGRRRRRGPAKGRFLPVESNRLLPVGLFLSIRGFAVHLRTWMLPIVVNALAVCIMIIPASMRSTFSSTEFATYMGSGVSDIRIDLQFVEDLDRKHEDIMGLLVSDSEIGSFEAYATCRYEVFGKEGWEDIQVQCGDHSDFGISYIEGRGPEKPGEIAVSSMNAKKLSAGVGDELTLRIGGEEGTYSVCGVYQDVTNGGYTAKMAHPYRKEDVLKYTYFIDTAEGIQADVKASQYAGELPFAKVIPMDEFLAQTFDMVIGPLSQVAATAVATAVFITMLVTVLFIKLNMARDYSQIANMKAIGFSDSDIRLQYVAGTGLAAVIGILAGIIISDALGESLVGSLISAAGFGLSVIDFIVQPLEVYLLYPAMVAAAAVLAAWFCSAEIRRYSIVRLIME